MKSELQDLHEYEADDAVMRSGADIKRYQLMLIKNAVGQRLYSMVNSFNHSSLKKRITMMFKEKSSPWARMKYLYVLPLTAFAAVAFARPEISLLSNEISSVKVSDFVSFAETNRVENQNLAVADTLLPEETQSSKESSYQVFEIVEELPVFPGGDGEMKKFIDRNLHYPESAQSSGTEGRVMVQFTVQSDGSITDAHVLKGLGEAFDTEAVRVVSSMPKWKPGMQRGEKVRVRYLLPITFRATGSTAGGVKESITSQQADSQSDSVQTVFTVVEQMPQFPGGETALMKYLADNLRYPIRAQENGIQGIVHVQFAVDEEGRIPFAKVMKSVDKDLDAEALRVVKSMPQWIPGMQRGRKVKVLMNLPVVFRLKR